MKTRPGFFLVGAPRCGTTALCRYLAEHAEVFVSNPKEPFFFAEDLSGLRRVDTLEEYLALFARAPDGTRIAGEGSTLYLSSAVALERIRDFDVAAKILVLLRDPVDFVSSFHAHLVYHQMEDVEDVELAWHMQEARQRGEAIPQLVREPRMLQYREIARFGSQVERLLELFPREQVRFHLLEDIAADPRAVYRDVLEFLGVSEDGRTDFPRVNENRQVRSRGIARFLESRPAFLGRGAARIRELIRRPDFAFLGPLKRLNTMREARNPLRPGFRAELVAEFRPEVELLAELIDRDLGHWLQPFDVAAPQ